MHLDNPAILNALPHAVLVRDGQGVVRFANAAAERLLAVRAADLVGGRELPWVGAEDLAAGHAKIQVNAGEVRLEVEVVPLDGAEAGSLVVYRVVMLLQTIEEYITSICYDVKIPLIAIRNCIAMVSRGFAGEINPQQKELLSLASQNVGQLYDATETLLQTMVLDFEQHVQEKEYCQLNSMLVSIFLILKMNRKHMKPYL